MHTIDYLYLAKYGDIEATLFLIQKFKPLLMKFARKLDYEDAYNDLQLDFIVLLRRMDICNLRNQNEGCVVTYISISLRNSFIKRMRQLKEEQKALLITDIIEGSEYSIQPLTKTEDLLPYYSGLQFFDLSETEKLVVGAIFIEGYSAADIARKYGISRQAVNKTKMRALRKLKMQIEDD